MAPSDDWRPYTIPYSGDGAVKRSDGTWVPSSKAHAPLVLAPQQPASSADAPAAPSPATDTSATAANDPGPHAAAGGFRGGPDIPSLPAQSPFAQAGHPRFAPDMGPGEGIRCAGGNPPAGCFGTRGYAGGENAQNAQGGQAEGGK